MNFVIKKNSADSPLLMGHYELIGQKWAIKLMDDLIDDRPLTGGGKTTFELIDHYLPILMGH